MSMRLSLGIALAVGLSGQAAAEAPAPCETLVRVLEASVGQKLTAPPAATRDGWCVLDGARTTGEGAVRASAEQLRVRGEASDDGLVSLEIEGKGLRAAAALNDRDLPDWLRDLLRLQTAEVHLALRRDEAADRLDLDLGQVRLSGGGELSVTAEIAEGHLSAASLLTGRVTKLSVEWKNDGRFLRPMMEAWGERLEPGSTGTRAVLAARAALVRLLAAMPEGSLLDEALKGAEAFIAAMPQGRGRLEVLLRSDNGIGAAQLGLLALSQDPTGPETMARVFAGTEISVSWTPGITP